MQIYYTNTTDKADGTNRKITAGNVLCMSKNMINVIIMIDFT